MSEHRKTEIGKAYFVTLTVVDWIDLFTRKEIAALIIHNLKICQQQKHLQIYSWCMMTSHIHLIASCTEKPLGELLRDFKGFTSKEIIKYLKTGLEESRRSWLLEMFGRQGEINNKNYQIWTQDNHPAAVYSMEVFNRKNLYIINNLVVSGIVTDASSYRYSSANPQQIIKTNEW
jgi:REP element-mobilizing transposase RayT